MLFSIFVWNETFLSVVLALYYLLKFQSLYQNLKKNSFFLCILNVCTVVLPSDLANEHFDKFLW